MSSELVHSDSADNDWGQYDCEVEVDGDVKSEMDHTITSTEGGRVNEDGRSGKSMNPSSSSTEDLLKDAAAAVSNDVEENPPAPPPLSTSEVELFEKMNRSPEPIPVKSQQNKRHTASSPKGNNQNHNSAGQGGMRGGMHSSPSFKELEMAIGQQLALGLSYDGISSGNLENIGSVRGGKKLGSRNSGNQLNMMGRSPIASPREKVRSNWHGYSQGQRRDVDSSRIELDPFIHEVER